ncbi:MAG: PEP-CTERM sorting domain-containing protein [Planctomycetota bacterium]
MRKFIFLALLLVVTIFVEGASALYLPESSFMDGAWEGVLNYVDEDLGFDVGIAYSVYDAYNLEPQSQEEAFIGDAQDELGLEGQYIYGYQLFNRPNDAEGEYSDLLYFGLLELDETPVDESLINGDTSAMDDHDGGIAPDSPSPRQGAWGFTESVLSNGEKSWILVFSSQYAPVRGTYTLTSSEPDFPIPDIPEPATIGLLGLGGIAFLMKRRTSK